MVNNQVVHRAARCDLLSAKLTARSRIARIVTAAIVAVGITACEAGDTHDELNALKRQVEELQKKIERLERNQNFEAGVGDGRKMKTALITAGADGFSMQSADTNFVLRIKGYGQFDGRAFLDDGPGKSTFVMRRLRLGLEGTVFENYDYRVLTDFGSGITSTTANNAFLQDALFNIHYWPQFQIQLGKFKEPVSLEVLQSDASLTFVERGLPTQLAPNRDVGIQFHGDLLQSKLNYALAIFNGVPDGGSGDVETADEDKDFVGRIFANPWRGSGNSWLKGLGIGIGGSVGHQEGSLPSYVTPGRQKFFSYLNGAGTATDPIVEADGLHWRVAPQGYYYYGPFGLFGEYVLSPQRVTRSGGAATSATLENSAWNIVLSYLLTQEENAFKSVVPRRAFSLREGGLGAWEIAARVGQLSVDNQAFPLFATSASAQEITSWGVGLNWYLNKNVKFNFDYEQSYFTGSAKKGTVTAQDEQVFMGRAQFAF